jgi:hypothetical protein
MTFGSAIFCFFGENGCDKGRLFRDIPFDERSEEIDHRHRRSELNDFRLQILQRFQCEIDDF